MSIQIAKKIDEQNELGDIGRVASLDERGQHVRVFYDVVGERLEQPVEYEGARRRAMLYDSAQFIWLVTGMLELLIALRILFKLIAANPDNSVVRFTHNFTSLFLWPFHGLTTITAADGMLSELGSLFAMSVYVVLAAVLIKILHLVFNPSSSPTTPVSEQDPR